MVPHGKTSFCRYVATKYLSLPSLSVAHCRPLLPLVAVFSLPQTVFINPSEFSLLTPLRLALLRQQTLLLRYIPKLHTESSRSSVPLSKERCLAEIH